jgi:Cytochrome c oxidase subunit IV
MRVEGLVFGFVAVFMAVLGIIYWFTSYEPTGTVLLALASGIGAIPGAFFLWHGTRMDARPEDRPDADPEDGAGVVGQFLESSVWPFVLAGGAALAGVGLVFGLWASLPGVALLTIAFVGASLESRSTH